VHKKWLHAKEFHFLSLSSFSFFFQNGVNLEVLTIDTKRFGIPTFLVPSSSTISIGA
jgi:hypothetical protein